MKVGDLVYVKTFHAGKYGTFKRSASGTAIIIARWGRGHESFGKAWRVLRHDGKIEAKLTKDLEVVK